MCKGTMTGIATVGLAGKAEWIRDSSSHHTHTSHWGGSLGLMRNWVQRGCQLGPDSRRHPDVTGKDQLPQT